jgi:hypothetical protein
VHAGDIGGATDRHFHARHFGGCRFIRRFRCDLGRLLPRHSQRAQVRDSLATLDVAGAESKMRSISPA